MNSKANVQVFNQDVLATGVYRYTDSATDIAKAFSNSRTSRAIARATSFSGKRVLDIGCGDGMFTVELAGLGAASICGIDPAAEAVESARARAKAAGLGSNVEFKVFNIYDLEPSFGKFDIVVIRGVLHHLSAPEKALIAVASVCDEIVVLEPNGCNPILKVIERFSTYHIQHEEQSFLPSKIDKWLQAAGKTPRRRELINLVPLFCSPMLARLLKWLEPIVEATPVLRLLGCGQYLVQAS